MYCGACGQQNADEHSYCSACGKLIQREVERPQENGHYSVILASTPAGDFERFLVSRKLAKVLNISEADAKAKVEHTPSIIASVGSMAEAEKVKRALEASGATLQTLIRAQGKENLEVLRKECEVGPPGGNVTEGTATPSVGLNRKLPPWVAWTVYGTLGAFFLWLVIATSDWSGTDGNKTSAKVMAQMFVEESLIAPSTAKFDFTPSSDVRDLGGGRYEVPLTVHSQNPFGVMIRNRCNVIVQHVGGEGYRWLLGALDCR